MTKFRWISGLIIAVFLFGSIGCGSEKPSLTPQEVTNRASEKMLTVNSFHFRIDVKGTGAYLDELHTMRLNFTEGDLARPDRVKATLNLAMLGVVVETQAVIIGQERLFTNPITNKWEPMPKEWGYDPTVLFDPDQGISGVAKKIPDLKMLGDEKVDGVDSYHVTGMVKASDILQFTAGMISGDQVKLDLWVGKDEFYVHQVMVEEPQTSDRKQTVWTMKLSSFNKPVSIESPVSR
ncbi:MAG: LppX_LprAFG lipoprotein [Chloroflexi bacterium]|nr:LppX_LprAFG lipoprotein [Chloroflexota bacterium]